MVALNVYVFFLLSSGFIFAKGQICSEIKGLSKDSYVANLTQNVCTVSSEPPTVHSLNNKIPCCKTCFCSTDCLFYNECCPDVDMNSFNNNPKVECMAQMYNGDDIISTINGMNFGINMYNMISSCSYRYPKDSDVEKCESTVPGDFKSVVIVSDSHGRVYKNEFCARCNYVHTFTTWDLKIACPNPLHTLHHFIPSLDIVVEKECRIWSSSPAPDIGQRSRCFKPHYTTCNETGKWQRHDERIRKACENLSHNYVFEDYFETTLIYKNIYCYICNDGPDVEIQKICNKPIDASEDFRHKEIVSFSAILNFETTQKLTIPDNSVESECKTYEVYDSYFGVCRELICPFGSTPSDGECLLTFENIKGKAIALVFRTTNSSSVVKDDAHFLLMENEIIINIDIRRFGCGICSVAFINHDNVSETGFTFVITVYTTSTCTVQTLWDFAERSKSKEYHFNIRLERSFHIEFTLALSQSVGQEAGDRYANTDYFLSVNICQLPIYIGGRNCPKFKLLEKEYAKFFETIPDTAVCTKEKSETSTTANSENTCKENETTYEVCIDDFQKRLKAIGYTSGSIVTAQMTTASGQLSVCIITLWHMFD